MHDVYAKKTNFLNRSYNLTSWIYCYFIKFAFISIVYTIYIKYQYFTNAGSIRSLNVDTESDPKQLWLNMSTTLGNQKNLCQDMCRKVPIFLYYCNVHPNITMGVSPYSSVQLIYWAVKYFAPIEAASVFWLKRFTRKAWKKKTQF
jgi:hypothetical protein